MYILFSINFVLYSFIEYLNQNPNVEYYKNNDYTTNKTFEISDSLLMFKINFFCYDFSRDYTLKISSIDDNRESVTELELEPCKLGKNINLKYKDLIKKFEKVEPLQINEYSCINFNNSNFTLFSHPSISQDRRNLLHLEILSECKDNYIYFTVVTQNDLIDHTQKNNPIVPYFQINNVYLENSVNTYLVYNYQFIKYESDNGFFLAIKQQQMELDIQDTIHLIELMYRIVYLPLISK